ncbi:RAMP superfamily CRISPR-associated protein [[Limnothrix rosea] IAM M-220]|uniref:RAMP superfamily CRISPR-associated protein n=1 Tax=[Limnothrix rosea] IAM M-220 TaxID=454133 RepID=UPI000965765F|nr:RAMP superfamily CRISPR-associated protein [[Limnothrix rosea] IAM M-220]OKH18641.1 hypothetical protein NIES208_05395 [[Limnothrix rosea] IAM M-220]
MARHIQTRWKISGIVKTETPIHVGGMGGDADTDLALAINGRGKYYIPGTSLAGAFRGWMGRILDDDDLKKIWGDHENDKRGASFIIIDDAEIKDNPNIEIREGVGIDRHTGAAADKAKYSRAILPKGITFPLEITFDCQNGQEPNELWQLLQALGHGDIRIGAAKTRGLGKIKLDKLTIRKHQLGNAKGLFNSLLSQNLKVKWEEEIKPNLEPYRSPSQLSLEIGWQPKDPVMVKAEGDGIAVDILPLVSQVNSDVRFVIPGSSIKGVLRAHAERIVRTVCHKSTQDDFLKQVELELVNKLFGSAEKKKNKPVPKGNKQQSQGNIGVLFVDDCYATLAMTAENWSAVENAAKTENEEFRDLKKTLGTALDTANGDNPFQTLQPAMHVAVDRWTGGAAEGMLYSVLEPIGVKWESIGIRLDLARLQKYGSNSELVKPAIALLLLVLRDFANRKIPIGYGTNRGMGTVAVTEMKLNSSPIDGLHDIENKQNIDANLLNLGDELLRDLTIAWQDWITQNSQNQEAA